jgi:hypothetical protein
VGGRNENERAAMQRAGGRISWNEDVEFKWLEAARHPSQVRMTRDVRRDNDLG